MSVPRFCLLPALLCLGLLLSACGKKGETAAPADPHAGHHHHDHAHVAPHGGTLVVVGDEAAHLELVLDPATGKLDLYVLDDSAKGGVRLKQKDLALVVTLGEAAHSLTLTAQAFGLTGETPEESSHFAGTFPQLVAATQFAVRVPALKIKGVDFGGLEFKFPEGNEGEAHEHHDH